MLLIIFVITIILLGIALVGLGITILLKKNGSFPETHIGRNKEMKKRGHTVFEISAATQKGVKELMNKTYEELSKLPPIQIFEPEMTIDEEEFFADDAGFVVRRENETFVVEGPWIEAVGGSVNFSDRESLQYFQRMLLNHGVIDALVEKGIKEGQIVKIGDLEFEFIF